jgi:hypothetical protein
VLHGVTIAMIFWGNFGTRVQDGIRDAISWIEDGLGSFTVVDWVLLGGAALAIVWLVASVRSLTRLGPVEVEALEHDAADDADHTAVKALTAALRERLARNGLIPPPEVPAGTPQVDLVAAVEASGAPQSAFLAKLIELAPKPPQPPRYKVSGVLLGQAPADCGLSFWVKPSREGGVLLDRVTGCSDHASAVEHAASKIYLHVSNGSEHAFPLWARWRDESSLERYVTGSQRVRDGDRSGAVTEFEAAESAEPFNALVRLQLANIYEACVPDEPRLDRAKLQSAALERYLDIASEWPELVEARYRVSIVSGALATTCDPPETVDDPLTPAELEEIAGAIGLPGTTAANLPDRLRDVAARESRAVLQLLRGWFMLVRQQRLRTAFEPKGHVRRELKHTVVISKHCIRMRDLCGRTDWRGRAEIRCRTFAVLFRHRFYGRGSLSWQAHYNASCFDALLLAHLRSQP